MTGPTDSSFPLNAGASRFEIPPTSQPAEWDRNSQLLQTTSRPLYGPERDDVSSVGASTPIGHAGVRDILTRAFAPKVDRTTGMAEYIERIVLPNPHLHSRNVCGYLRDAMTAFGVTPAVVEGQQILKFGFVTEPWLDAAQVDRNTLLAQDLLFFRIYKFNEQQAERARPNRGLITGGPYGTGKTTLHSVLTSLLEIYSTQIESGALFRAVLKLPGSETIFRSPGNLHPFAIIPQEQRRELINLLKKEHPESRINENFLMSLRPDPLMAHAIQQMQRQEHASEQEVLAHAIRIEPFYLDHLSGAGIIHRTPGPDPLLHAAPLIGTERKMRDLEPSALKVLQDIVTVSGGMLSADRGSVYLNDLTRLGAEGTPQEQLKAWEFLVNIIDKGLVSVDQQGAPALQIPLQILFRSDANDHQLLTLMQQAPGFQRFARRVTVVPAPAILQLSAQAEQFRTQLKSSIAPDHICRLALESLALFAVSMRMFRPNPQHYDAISKPLSEAVTGMSTVAKAILLDSQPSIFDLSDLNSTRQAVQAGENRSETKWTPEQLNLLAREVTHIATEHYRPFPHRLFPLYDGGFGTSPAELETVLNNLLLQLSSQYLTVIDVLDFLEEGLKGSLNFGEYLQTSFKMLTNSNDKNSDIDQLRKLAPDANTCFQSLHRLVISKMTNDLNTALISERKDDNRVILAQYLSHVFAQLTRNMPNPRRIEPRFKVMASPNPDEPNEAIMLGFEREFIVNENGHAMNERETLDFRSSCLCRPGNHGNSASGNPADSFPDILTRMAEKQHRESQVRRDTFFAAVRTYADIELLAKDKGDVGKRQAAEEFESIRGRLIKLGYPEETFSRHFIWLDGQLNPKTVTS